MPAVACQELKFADLKKGMKARVMSVDDDCEACTRLQEMGLTVGAVFTVIKIAPFGDPVEIDLRGYRLCLRKKESGCFTLELVV